MFFSKRAPKERPAAVVIELDHDLNATFHWVRVDRVNYIVRFLEMTLAKIHKRPQWITTPFLVLFCSLVKSQTLAYNWMSSSLTGLNAPFIGIGARNSYDVCFPLGRCSHVTKPRSCGGQSTHRASSTGVTGFLSLAVRTSAPTSSAATKPNNCVRTLGSLTAAPQSAI